VIFPVPDFTRPQSSHKPAIVKESAEKKRVRPCYFLIGKSAVLAAKAFPFIIFSLSSFDSF